MVNIGGPKPKHFCQDCKKSFLHIRNYLEHRKVHHEGIRFQCQYCDQSYTRQYNLNHHQLQFHPEKLSQATRELLQRQWGALQRQNKQLTNKTYQKCQRPAHLRQVVKKPIKLTVVKSAQKPNNGLTKKINNGACPMCPFETVQSERLTVHLLRHKKQEKYKCKLCSYSCDKEMLVAQHRGLHFGWKEKNVTYRMGVEGKPLIDVKLSCLLCGCGFKEENELREHEMMHC